MAIAQCDGELLVIKDKQALDNYLKEIFFKSEITATKVLFTFKIDSLGEIHSCHVRSPDTLSNGIEYAICQKLETCIRARFLFTEFRWAFPDERYVYVNYPYIKQ